MDNKNIQNEKINTSDQYPYSQWMLDEIKGEYIVENERENKISTKASAFITVIVAVITLYIPLIPFDKLRPFFEKAALSQSEKSLAIIFIIVLGTGLFSLTIAFLFLLKAYGVKGYNRVRIDNLLTIANEIGTENEIRKSLLAKEIASHYHEILRGTVDQDGNMKINSTSAEALSIAIVWTVVGFVILSIATIALRIIIV